MSTRVRTNASGACSALGVLLAALISCWSIFERSHRNTKPSILTTPVCTKGKSLMLKNKMRAIEGSGWVGLPCFECPLGMSKASWAIDRPRGGLLAKQEGRAPVWGVVADSMPIKHNTCPSTAKGNLVQKQKEQNCCMAAKATGPVSQGSFHVTHLRTTEITQK